MFPIRFFFLLLSVPWKLIYTSSVIFKSMLCGKCWTATCSKNKSVHLPIKDAIHHFYDILWFCPLPALPFCPFVILSFCPFVLWSHVRLMSFPLALYTLYTLHYTLNTIHYTLSIIHYTLYTIHQTIYSIQYALWTFHYTLYTRRYTLYIKYYRQYNIQ